MNAAVETIDGLCSRLTRYLEDDEIRQVRRAYLYSEQAHDGQKRRSGDPYITHPLQVAEILADMRMDHQSLMAAMLHDVIEDTGIAKDALQEQFGEAVAELVDGVSKLTHISFETRAEAQAENFQNDPRDGSGSSGHYREARGPVTQHANDWVTEPRKAAADRERDPRHIQPHRESARNVRTAKRTPRARLPRDVSHAYRAHRTCRPECSG